MTRLEKIRSMTAEELAEELYEVDFDAFCKPAYCPYYTADGCEIGDEWDVDWAKLEVACKAACVRYLNGEIEDK
jgi:hypothetical protein